LPGTGKSGREPATDSARPKKCSRFASAMDSALSMHWRSHSDPPCSHDKEIEFLRRLKTPALAPLAVLLSSSSRAGSASSANALVLYAQWLRARRQCRQEPANAHQQRVTQAGALAEDRRFIAQRVESAAATDCNLDPTNSSSAKSRIRSSIDLDLRRPRGGSSRTPTDRAGLDRPRMIERGQLRLPRLALDGSSRACLFRAPCWLRLLAFFPS
jgi:hypothetical protein